MTPEDVAEIRAVYAMWDSTNEWKFGDRLADMVPDLCDALEASWAARNEELRSYAAAWGAEIAKVTELRAKLERIRVIAETPDIYDRDGMHSALFQILDELDD